MPEAALNLWFSGFPVIIALFMAVLVYAEISKNGGIVDVFWGFGFSVMVLFYAFVHTQTAGASAIGLRAQLVIGMVLLWSLRLTFYLLLRFLRLYPEEDPRYRAFREAWGDRARLGMFLAFLLQALLLSSLGLAFSVPLVNSSSAQLSALELGAVVLFFISLMGESLADKQLEDFRKNPANKGKVCQSGLWNYSRHPNYFFEWLVWLSFSLFAMASPGGLFTMYCPLIMYFFLTRVTGIKATEEQSLLSKGELYRAYQESTSAFFPWFKRASK